MSSVFLLSLHAVLSHATLPSTVGSTPASDVLTIHGFHVAARANDQNACNNNHSYLCDNTDDKHDAQLTLALALALSPTTAIKRTMPHVAPYNEPIVRIDAKHNNNNNNNPRTRTRRIETFPNDSNDHEACCTYEHMMLNRAIERTTNRAIERTTSANPPDAAETHNRGTKIAPDAKSVNGPRGQMSLSKDAIDASLPNRAIIFALIILMGMCIVCIYSIVNEHTNGKEATKTNAKTTTSPPPVPSSPPPGGP